MTTNPIKYAEYFMMAEFMKARLAISQKEKGREGVDFIVKTNSGKYHEIYFTAHQFRERQKR